MDQMEGPVPSPRLQRFGPPTSSMFSQGRPGRPAPQRKSIGFTMVLHVFCGKGRGRAEASKMGVSDEPVHLTPSFWTAFYNSLSMVFPNGFPIVSQ